MAEPSVPATGNSRSSRRRFFLFREEKVEGPYSLTQLLEMRNNRQLRTDTPCCLEGSKEWQTVEVYLMHKLGNRRIRRTSRSTFASFSRRTLPMLIFALFGLISSGIGLGMIFQGSNQFIGFVMLGSGFVLAGLGYFLFPRSVRD